MKIDILCKRKFKENRNAIDIAFPVIAIQCELTPPLHNYLNSLERFVLQLISCGFSIENISKKIRLAEPLIHSVFNELCEKEYIKYKSGEYELSDDGKKYLTGQIEECFSSRKKYGWMFFNPITKDVFPFFWEGNIEKIPLWDENYYPLKLLKKSEKETFSKSIKIKKIKLEKAYKIYFNLEILRRECKEDEIPIERISQLFGNLLVFDEIEEDEKELEEDIEESNSTLCHKKMFIRQMETDSCKFYLHMRIIIDPASLGGYRVESPFFASYDEFFKKYIQLFMKQSDIFLNNAPLKKFLLQEICKLSSEYSDKEKDFDVFITQHIPLLVGCKSHFSTMYDDLCQIHSLIRRDSGLMYKKNIVSNFASSVVEHLFDKYFRYMKNEDIVKIQQSIFERIDNPQSFYNYRKRLLNSVGLPESTFNEIKFKGFQNILGRMTHTYGNSIKEKFINLLVIHDYYSNARDHKPLYNFFSQVEDIQKTYECIKKLNDIRNKVAHNAKNPFTENDYNIYMEHVFPMVQTLLAPWCKD